MAELHEKDLLRLVIDLRGCESESGELAGFYDEGVIVGQCASCGARRAFLSIDWVGLRLTARPAALSWRSFL